MLSTAMEAEAGCYAASSMISLYCCGVRVFGQSGTLTPLHGGEAPQGQRRAGAEDIFGVNLAS